MLAMPQFRTTGEVLSTDEFVKELDAAIHQPGRDRTEHPFVLAVERGEATIDQIAGWRNQITQWAHPTNKLFGIMWSRCNDDAISEGIFENMVEELSGTYSQTGGHIQLNWRFLDELGWDKPRRAADETRPETWALRHWFEVVVACRPVVESIAALSFTAERLNPFVLGRVYEGLKKNYDISDEALMSVAGHASHVEEEHGSLGPDAFARWATTAYTQDRVRFTVLHTAEVYYNMYNVWQYY